MIWNIATTSTTKHVERRGRLHLYLRNKIDKVSTAPHSTRWGEGYQLKADESEKPRMTEGAGRGDENPIRRR